MRTCINGEKKHTERKKKKNLSYNSLPNMFFNCRQMKLFYLVDFTMSIDDSISQISGIKQWETDIRHAFNRHVMTLFAAKWKMFDEITEWRKRLVQWIEEYDKQQRNLLEEHYGKKVTALTASRDQLLEQAGKYDEIKETEQINQLVDQCNTMKVELAVLVEMIRPIPSFQIVTDRQESADNRPEQITPPPE